MFGIEPTPFDLRMVAFRIPIRVHPSFWIAGVILGWSPDHPDLMFIWVMCLFISILIHELGHGLMAEAFGWPTEILLYFGGGLAMPQARNRTPWRDIALSLAGPFAGFGLAAVTIGIAALLPKDVHPNIDTLIGFLLFINIAWGCVNLLPVLPLDGGHVCHSLVALMGFRNPARIATQISLVVSAGVAIFFFAYLQMSFAGMMFAFFSFQNYAALQSPEIR